MNEYGPDFLGSVQVGRCDVWLPGAGGWSFVAGGLLMFLCLGFYCHGLDVEEIRVKWDVSFRLGRPGI